MHNPVSIGFLIAVAMLLVPSVALSMSSRNQPISSDDPGATRAEKRVGARGTVRTESGAPVAGAVVFARSLDEPGKPIPEIAIVTDAEGAFHWPLRPGLYELTPMLDGHKGSPGKVTVPESGLGTIELTLSR